MISKEKQIVRNTRRHYKRKGHENLTRNKRFSNSGTRKGRWNTTQLPKRKDSNQIQMQELVIQARNRCTKTTVFKKLEKKSEDITTRQVPWSITSKSHLQNLSLGGVFEPKNFDYEATESERYRLKSQESFVSHGAQGRCVSASTESDRNAEAPWRCFPKMS